MSKYGNGLNSMQVCALVREQIERALNGELICGETENGFGYASADKAKCDRFILEAYDELVYQLNNAESSGRATEKLIEQSGVRLNFRDYMQKMQEECQACIGDYPAFAEIDEEGKEE